MIEREIRLNKYLADCGICSRRDADKLIEQGVVSVDGKIALMGMKVTGQEEVVVRGKKIAGRDRKIVLAYYKPRGVVCTERDVHADKIVTDEIKYPVRVTYAGRLDKDSEGLMLLTNDGELIQALMKGSAGHEKEYLVRVNREVTEDFLQKMGAGVYLSELDITTNPCRVEKNGKYQFKIVLTQGVNRQIKRMTRELGVHVISIKRTRIMNISLKGLKNGEYRKLSKEEIQVLYNSCFGKT